MATSVTLAGRLRLVGRHHLGAEVTWSQRRAGVQAPLAQEGLVVRVSWVLPFADAVTGR